MQLREELQVKNAVLEKIESGNTSPRINKLSDV
jgi:ribosome-binding protein aMBF1 (putative translation factor)